MKNKIIIAIIMITIFFIGCSRVKEGELFSKGKVALEKHEYKEAQEIFSQVLSADSTNENARSMYMQAVKMKDALEYANKHLYDKAIESLEAIEKLKGGSSKIKSEASEKKKEIIKLNEAYKKAQEQRKENAKQVSSQENSKLEENALKENHKNQREEINQEEQKQDNQEEQKQEDSNQQHDGLGNILNGIFGNIFDSNDGISDESVDGETEVQSNQEVQSEDVD